MILRLPLRVAGLAAGAAGRSLRLAGTVAEVVVERLVGGRTEHAPAPTPPEAPSTPPPPAYRPSRDGAAAGAPASSSPAAPPVRSAPPVAPATGPTRADAARLRAEQREAEETEDGPGAEIRIGEPWPGYAQMRAPDIVDRLVAADMAQKAVVLLYEQANRARRTVLEAASKP